jgi:hypothetical protein
MKRHLQFWTATSAGIILGLGVGALRADAPAAGVGLNSGTAKTNAKSAPDRFAGNKKTGAKEAPGDEGEPDELLQIKVFRLRHVDPDVLAKVAGKLFLPPGAMPGVPPGFGVPKPGDPAGAGFGGLGGAGFGGFGGAGFGGLGGAGFGLGGLGFVGGGPGFLGVRFAADKRTRAFLVRGSAEDIQVVTNLVALVDLKPGQPRPKVPRMASFDLRHSTPESVAEAVEKLGIEVQVAAVPNTRTLVVVGEEPAIRQVRLVVEALDVAETKAGR